LGGLIAKVYLNHFECNIKGRAQPQHMGGLIREDLGKIEKSLKKPEFMGLLNEYMVKISDPKNKND
jgi:hypothetical protein